MHQQKAVDCPPPTSTKEAAPSKKVGLCNLKEVYEGRFREALVTVIEEAAAGDPAAKSTKAAKLMGLYVPKIAGRQRSVNLPDPDPRAAWVKCNVAPESKAAHMASYCPSFDDPRSFATNCATMRAVIDLLPSSCGMSPTCEGDVTMVDLL